MIQDLEKKCLEILQVFLKKSDTVEQRKGWSSLTPSAHVLKQTGLYISKILDIKFCRIFIWYSDPIFLQETSSSSSSKEVNLPCAGLSDLADLGAKYWLLLIYQKKNHNHLQIGIKNQTVWMRGSTGWVNARWINGIQSCGFVIKTCSGCYCM